MTRGGGGVQSCIGIPIETGQYIRSTEFVNTQYYLYRTPTIVVLCAVGPAQPDDTNWIWNTILFSVWTLRWKPANTAQLKAVVSCLKYISYIDLFPSGERVFSPILMWWWNCQRDCLYCSPLSWLRKTCRIIYSSDWILPTRKYTSPFNFLVRTLKRKRTRRVPYFIPFNWRIKKFIKRKIESRLCFRHTLNRHSFKRLQLWLDLLLLFLRHNKNNRARNLDASQQQESRREEKNSKIHRPWCVYNRNGNI